MNTKTATNAVIAQPVNHSFTKSTRLEDHLQKIIAGSFATSCDYIAETEKWEHDSKFWMWNSFKYVILTSEEMNFFWTSSKAKNAMLLLDDIVRNLDGSKELTEKELRDWTGNSVGHAIIDRDATSTHVNSHINGIPLLIEAASKLKSSEEGGFSQVEIDDIRLSLQVVHTCLTIFVSAK
jgi:hypothetical protein